MEQQDNAAIESQPTAISVSPFKGLAQVFYNPAGWFEQIQHKPKVLVPYIVLGVLTLVAFYLMSDQLVEMQLNSPQLQEQLQGQSAPPNMRQILMYSTVGGGTLVFLLAPLAAAVLALFWGNVVFAGHAGFKTLLSLMLYGELIFAVGHMLTMPLVLAKKSLAVGFNLGVLVADRGLEDALYVALSRIDLFIIWEIIVIGIGLSVIYRFPRNKGLLTSVLSMGLLSVFGVLAAVVKSMF